MSDVFVSDDVHALSAGRVNWIVDPARAVFLINDMQIGSLATIGATDTLIANLGHLRQWARDNGVPVVFGAHAPDRRSLDHALDNDLWGHDRADLASSRRDIVSSIMPDATDTVLNTVSYSAFHKTGLLHRMEQWGRDQLIIGGVHTSVGCLATAMDAFMNSVQAFVVRNAIADIDENENRRALIHIATRFGCVVDTADVVTDRASDPTRDWLRQRLSQMLEDDTEIDPEESLLFYGLDSLRVMTLAAELETRGIHIGFEQLARTPTLANWYRLIETSQQAA